MFSVHSGTAQPEALMIFAILYDGPQIQMYIVRFAMWQKRVWITCAG